MTFLGRIRDCDYQEPCCPEFWRDRQLRRATCEICLPGAEAAEAIN